jgi:hypothetical protein
MSTSIVVSLLETLALTEAKFDLMSGLTLCTNHMWLFASCIRFVMWKRDAAAFLNNRCEFII